MRKCDGTISANSKNYYSYFSNVKFSWEAYFIFPFDINSNYFYCKGLKQVKYMIDYNGILKSRNMKKIFSGLNMTIMELVMKLNTP